MAFAVLINCKFFSGSVSFFEIISIIPSFESMLILQPLNSSILFFVSPFGPIMAPTLDSELLDNPLFQIL